MRDEASWVKKGLIPVPHQQIQRKVVTLFEDPETILAGRQHIPQVDDSKFIS